MISVVLSFRNEADIIPELVSRLDSVFKSISTDYELIFINDDSTDDSLDILSDMAGKDSRIKVLNMTRRFGISECVIAGMEHAKGDAVIYMDSDLQDPPEIIPDLVNKWKDGADIVHTVRSERKGEPPFKLWLTSIAYRLIRATSDIELIDNAGDFKLLSRQAVDDLLKMKEHRPYMRGIVAWLGFTQDKVYYAREARAGGLTHFPLFKRFFRDVKSLSGPVGTLLIGVSSFAFLPLVMSFFAFMGAIACLVAVATIIIQGELGVQYAVIAFFFGMNFFGMSVIMLYLARIHEDARGRPRYIIKSKIGFGDDKKES